MLTLSASPTQSLVTRSAQPSARACPSEAYPPDLPRIFGTGTWQFAGSFAELVSKADLVLVGEVICVRPGRQCCGASPLPTSDSEVRITSILKGVTPASAFVTVEQTGGVYLPIHERIDAGLSPAPLPSEAPPSAEPLPTGSLPPAKVLELEEDPIFRVGEWVILAVAWNGQAGRYQLATGPQGRFRLRTDNTVELVVTDDAATSSLAGLTLEGFATRVRAVGQ